MAELFQNVLTASFHGSIVIAAVLLLRLILRRAPKKFLCMLWLLAGLRLLMPFEIESSLSLQPETDPVTYVQQQVMAPVYLPELDGPPLEPAAPAPQAPAPSEVPVQPPGSGSTGGSASGRGPAGLRLDANHTLHMADGGLLLWHLYRRGLP